MTTATQRLKTHLNSIAELESQVQSIRQRLTPVENARTTVQNAQAEVRASTNKKRSLLAQILLGSKASTEEVDAEIATAREKLDQITIDEEVTQQALAILQAEIDPLVAEIQSLNAITANLQREAMLEKIERIKFRYLNSVEDVKQAYLELAGAAKLYDDHWRAGFSNVTPIAFSPTLEFILPMVAAESRQIYARFELNDLNAYKASFANDLKREGVLFY
jgi:chromosome segregation ATPase